MMGFNRTPLLTSIAKVLAYYLILETFAFLAVGLFFRFSYISIFAFLIVQIVYFSALSIFLYLCRNFFYIESSGERLTKVNIANKITLLRVSMLPFILFLILATKDYDIAPVLLPVIAITFITDIVDGRISRARNEVTHIGRILDSVSDYSLLIVIAVVYRVFNLLPNWLFLIIFFRLLFQAVGMFAVLLIKKKVEPQPTMFGKIAVATTMALFALEALKLALPQDALGFFFYFEVTAGILVGLSVFDKGYFFLKQAKDLLNGPRL